MSTKKTYTCSANVNICSNEKIKHTGIITSNPITLDFTYTPPDDGSKFQQKSFPINASAINDFNKKLLANQPPKRVSKFKYIADGSQTFIGDPNELFNFSENKQLLSNMQYIGYPSEVADYYTVLGIAADEHFYVTVNDDLYYPLLLTSQREYPNQTFRGEYGYYPDDHTFTTDVPVDKVYMPWSWVMDTQTGYDAYQYPDPLQYTPIWELDEVSNRLSFYRTPRGYYTVDFNGSDTLTFFLYPEGLARPEATYYTIQHFFKIYYLQIDLKFTTSQGFILLKEGYYTWKIKYMHTPKIRVEKDINGWVTNVKHIGYYSGSEEYQNNMWPGTSYRIKLCFSPTWTCDIFKYSIDKSLTLPYELDSSSSHQVHGLGYYFKDEEYALEIDNNVLNISTKERDYPHIYASNLIMKESFTPEEALINKKSNTITELHLQDELQIKIDDSKSLLVTGDLQIDSVKISGRMEIGDDSE